MLFTQQNKEKTYGKIYTNRSLRHSQYFIELVVNYFMN